ncbi:MAG: AAA family ATPase [Vicinamibacterales bacterium]
MRLHRLHVKNFGGVRDVAVEFGPGLNVLYGPNDLGKSTLVEAIRLALLLPHGSNHSDPYVPWDSGASPFVELCFETEAQRIWRVRKEFGRGGRSSLESSKNGRDYEDVEQGRKVDGKLREMLGWGIPEPGGSGSSRGLPRSFLATALLSTQADVTAVLNENLGDDQDDSGKERIAEALQAVAQDPLFVELLRATQAKRDEAYTDKGAKKQARGSVFKVAAERVNAAREEMTHLQHIVAESDGVEAQIGELTSRRDERQQSLDDRFEGYRELETLLRQTEARAEASESVRAAQEGVRRIEKMDADIAASEATVQERARDEEHAKGILEQSQSFDADTRVALKALEDIVREEQRQPGIGDEIARKDLELRRIAAQQSAADAERRIQAIQEAQNVADGAARAVADVAARQAEQESCRSAFTDAESHRSALADAISRCGRLEQLAEVNAAQRRLEEAEGAVQKKAEFQRRNAAAEESRAQLLELRQQLVVPDGESLLRIRKIDGEVAAARAALDLGLVVTLKPVRPLTVQVRKDNAELESQLLSGALDIEADSAIDVTIPDVVTFGVAAGRPDARARAHSLQESWKREVLPHFTAAGAATLEAFEAKVEKVRGLDASIREQTTLIESLAEQIAPLGEAEALLALATERLNGLRAEAGELDDVRSNLPELGSDPATALRSRRSKLSADLEVAQQAMNSASTAYALANERSQQTEAVRDDSIRARDAALVAFPEGLSTVLREANAAHELVVSEIDRIGIELATLERSGQERRARIEAALKDASDKAEEAGRAVSAAQMDLTTAVKAHSEAKGHIIALQAQRGAEDLEAAQTSLRQRNEYLATLPLPKRAVTEGELLRARTAVDGLQQEVEGIERDIQRAQGALEQVGGAVARERLSDAIEAYELAVRSDRETETEYEAWLLLLEQMNAANAAQASNLGQAFVPAIMEGFRELTRQRYDGLELGPELGTQGVVVSGTVRPRERLSVGTREQLSTIYRLTMADYLRTAVVLDDQLVQSDEWRMEWFRQVLTEKARRFQVLVFTCRASDYLAKSSLVPKKGPLFVDSGDGLTRAIDLGRALG